MGSFAAIGSLRLNPKYFHGAYSDPATGEMLFSGTEGRAGSVYWPDHEGIQRQFGANEPGYMGGRVTGSVGSRVVYGTDELGDPLPEIPWLMANPQVTNLMPYARDFSQWDLYNNGIVQQDQEGIDGNSNSAFTLTDSDSSGAVLFMFYISQDPSNDIYTVKFRIRKNPSPASYPAISLRVYNASGDVRTYLIVSPVDGSLVPGSYADLPILGSHAVLLGKFWEISISFANADTGSGAIGIGWFPALSYTGSPGDYNPAVTGSCVVDWFELYRAPLAQAITYPPTLTDGAAVTTLASAPQLPLSYYTDHTEQGLWYCEVLPQFNVADTEVAPFGLLTTNSPIGGQAEFGGRSLVNTYDGVTIGTSGSKGATAGVPFTALVGWELNTGKWAQLDDLRGSDVSHTQQYPEALGHIRLLGDTTTSVGIRNIQMYDASLEEGKVIADGLAP